MNNRIRQLRKELGLTQEKFGEKLGLKKNSISQIENGINSLTEQLSLSVCREFNVSEKWLRTGEGEMFIPVPEEDEVAAYVEDLLADDGENELYNLIKSIMRTYNELSPKSQEVLRDASKKLVENLKKEKGD
ncbi:MAG: helix-turn-helix transcriptional regulator [Lachnospiraceae bacterium]|nr:helix-turn-helix transcriptional regulator [Lachnospiraceae bacterium]